VGAGAAGRLKACSTTGEVPGWGILCAGVLGAGRHPVRYPLTKSVQTQRHHHQIPSKKSDGGYLVGASLLRVSGGTESEERHTHTHTTVTD